MYKAKPGDNNKERSNKCFGKKMTAYQKFFNNFYFVGQ